MVRGTSQHLSKLPGVSYVPVLEEKVAFLHRNPAPVIYKGGTEVWAHVETMKIGNISPELHFAPSGPPNSPSLETMGRAR